MSKLLNKRTRTLLLLIADIIGVVASAFFAYVLMLISHFEPFAISNSFLIWTAANIALALGMFWLCGLYRMVLSSVSVVEGLRICSAVAVLGILNGVFALFVGMPLGLGIGIFMPRKRTWRFRPWDTFARKC